MVQRMSRDRHQICNIKAPMAELRKQAKQLKRDQTIRREVRGAVQEETRNGAESQPLIKKPNRDQARGHWDRTGNHNDAQVERDETE